MYHSRIFIHTLKTIQQLPLNFFCWKTTSQTLSKIRMKIQHKNYHNKTTTQKLILENEMNFFPMDSKFFY